jgi:hypothetical protein
MSSNAQANLRASMDLCHGGIELIWPRHWPSSSQITDTSCRGAHHKVSGEPTLHDMGLRLFGQAHAQGPAK